jgi:2-dehydropantoate 2-reductase
MKIVFFGAGAIGAFYGGMLARAEAADVWFVARGAHLAAMRKSGLRIETKYGDFRLEKPNVTDNAKEIGTADLVVISVKEYQTAGILDDLTPLLGADTILMPFQNGVDGDRVLAEKFGAERVIGGVPIISVNLIEPGFVRHVASGGITVGEFDGPISERVKKIVAAFQRTGVPAQISTNIRESLWHKLLWNAGFTSLICLTGCDSHEIMDVPETCKLVRQAIGEAIEIGKRQNFNFAPDHLELIFDGTRAQPPIRTSMLFDREAGRPLEYEAITALSSKEENNSAFRRRRTICFTEH